MDYCTQEIGNQAHTFGFQFLFYYGERKDNHPIEMKGIVAGQVLLPTWIRSNSTHSAEIPTQKNPHQNLFFSLIFKKDYYFCR